MNEADKKVSIIVPVYNTEKYIDECICSLVSQTYKNIELIIIDDGSKDNSGKKADEYASKNNMIKVFHTENKGLSSARNYGLKYATGDFICFIDSDDYVTEDFVEKMVSASISNNTDMVFCNYFSFYVNKVNPSLRLSSIKDKKIFTPEEYLEKLYVYSGEYVMVWNKLFRREIFSELRFANMLCEDGQIILSVIDKCKRISYLSEPMYYYRRRKSGIMGEKREVILLNNMKWIKEHMAKLKKTNRIHLLYAAQKLYISKIVENYIYCKKETRKKLKESLKKELKLFTRNSEFRRIIKIKYMVAANFPYMYGKYYSIKNRDNNTYWE